MPRGEPKVMWSARLPSDLIDQIEEAAGEEGVSQGVLAEQAFGEWLDARSTDGRSQAEGVAAPSARGPAGPGRPEQKGAAVVEVEDAAQEALEVVEQRLAVLGSAVRELVVCVALVDGTGAVVGLSSGSPTGAGKLLGDLMGFTTIVAGAAGRQLRVVSE